MDAGLDATDLEVVHDANNTVVLLPRAGLVGKVATSTLGDRAGADQARELRIARHLAARGAPIVPPAPAAIAGPHRTPNGAVTFWEHCRDAGEPAGGAVRLGHALRAVHAALADVDEELPSLASRLDDAVELYHDPSATPGLDAQDRRLAARVHGGLHTLLVDAGEPRPLHGEPHGGNVVWTANGPRLLDFEAVCSGPSAWDLAYLPAESLAAFPDADRGLVERFRDAVSFAVAAWCWAQPDGPAVVTEAARVHLAALRRSPLGR